MTTAAELVAAAKATVENLNPAEVAKEIAETDAVLVDIREPTETKDEVIGGALLAPRGMLEFHADPSSPYHLEALQPDRRVILYCSAGSRSALGAQALQGLGYTDVAHLDGGITKWKEAGHPTEAPK